MSSIAIWINNYEHNSIWAVCDTRYSTKNTSSILTDNGPKIFELQIICYEPKSSGFFDCPYWFQKIGLAFAGSALAALCIYTNLNKILGNLGSTEKYIPSIKDIHDCVIRIAKTYTTPLKNQFPIEFSTFGFCIQEKKNKIFHTQINNNNAITTIDETDLCHTSQLLLGAFKTEIEEQINEFRIKTENQHPIINGRAPQFILKDIVKNNTYPSIGGGIQLGFTKGKDFNLCSVMEQLFDNTPKATFKYSNIDLINEVKNIGNCSVIMPGMA